MAYQYSRKTKLNSLKVLEERRPKHPQYYESLQVAYASLIEDIKSQYPLDVVIKPVYDGLRGFKFVVLKDSRLYEIVRHSYESLLYSFRELIY